jgi:aspartyl-tRNA(Asn)/glutamyl-tRNA(Gln) amidotransferase subunit A
MTAPLRIGQDAVAAAATLTAYTSPFNLTGLPAISIPCGFDANGLPIGLQLVARPWAEARLLRVARAYERATSWHERRPGRGPAPRSG